MADIKLNFSSQWPSVQVAKVIASPQTVGGEAISYGGYVRRHKHNLGYPPLAVAMGPANGAASYNAMEAVDVDDTYIYVDTQTFGWPAITCIVVYALDITNAYDYKNYESAIGDVVEDTSGGTIDLRKFLLHSRAVSPMVLSVRTKDYTLSDLTFTYTSPLNYPTFQFGYIRNAYDGGAGSRPVGVWIGAPLAAQAWPVLQSDGFTSSLGSTTISGQLGGDKGSIITLRNPAIITNNSVSVSI